MPNFASEIRTRITYASSKADNVLSRKIPRDNYLLFVAMPMMENIYQVVFEAAPERLGPAIPGRIRSVGDDYTYTNAVQCGEQIEVITVESVGAACQEPVICLANSSTTRATSWLLYYYCG